MNQRFHLFAGIVCALTAIPAVASAQTQTWLSDRKYTEGIGLRVGDFELHPGAAAEFGYDSNFYRRAPEESPIGALRLRITPSFSISTLTKARRDAAPSSTQPDFEFRATASATYNEFFPISGGRDSDDRAQMSRDRNVSGDLDLRLGIMPGRTWSGNINAGVARALMGLVMDEKGVLRHGQKVLTANGDGEILSGTFSPSIGKAIAFARVPAGEPGDVRVDIRGKEIPVRVVKFPFVREGKVQDGIL